MTEIVNFPTEKSKIISEACAWLARVDHGDLSEEDKKELNVWINQSDLHKQEIERLAQFWDNISDAKIDLDEIDSYKDSPDEKIASNEQKSGKFSYKYVRSIAASLILMVAIGFMFYLNNIAEFKSMNGKYSTNIGGFKTIQLSVRYGLSQSTPKMLLFSE